MSTYTTRQAAERTGKTLQAISRYAQAHPGIGKKFGRDWIFSEADMKVLSNVRMGRPSKRRHPKPTPTQPSPKPTP